MDKYYVIYQFDTDATVRGFSRDELLDWLEDSDYKFVTDAQITGENDPAMWGDDHILIIKGRAIQPKPKTVTTTYDL